MTTTISRRKTLQMFGLAGAASLFGSGQAMATTVLPKKWDMTCDVLVVGGGAAGMFAAVSAKEAKAGEVILLEKKSGSLPELHQLLRRLLQHLQLEIPKKGGGKRSRSQDVCR